MFKKISRFIISGLSFFNFKSIISIVFCFTISNFKFPTALARSVVWELPISVISLTFLSANVYSSASPVDLLQEALEFFMDEKYEESIEIFQRILRIDKSHEIAKKGLRNAQKKRQIQIEKIREKEGPALKSAKKHMKRKEWVDAIDRLNEVLERVPDHPQAVSMMKKIRAFNAKKFKKSNSLSSDWYFAQGVLSYIDGDWFKAANSWEQVYIFNPDMVSLAAKIEMAKTKLSVQQQKEKIVLFQTVAWDHLKKGQYQEAIGSWEEVLALEAHNAEAREGIRQAKQAAKQAWRKNMQERIEKLSAQAMDAYIDRKYKKSLKIWKKVLSLDPGNSLGVEYVKRIQKRRMTSETYNYKEYEVGAPIESGYEKALVFIEKKKYIEAIEYLERHLSKHPDDEKAQSALDKTRAEQNAVSEKCYKDGLVAYSQGHKSVAIQYWQDALKVNHEFQRARQALIKALAEEKK